MKEFHIHVHVDPELLAEPEGSVHIHLTADSHAAGKKRRRRRKKRRRDLLEPSGHVVMQERSGMQLYGCAPMTSGEIVEPTFAREQRIRSKMYRLDAVPFAEGGDTKSVSKLFSDPKTCSNVILELATGNQINPIVWESCNPESQRGLWRLSVREDYGRLLGIITHARDRRAIWVLSDWTPRGSLVLEPSEPERYPRLMLTPVSTFQR
jgi:hypothetical protein